MSKCYCCNSGLAKEGIGVMESEEETLGRLMIVMKNEAGRIVLRRLF